MKKRLGIEQTPPPPQQPPPVQIKEEPVKEEPRAAMEPLDESDNPLTIDETALKSSKIPSGKLLQVS